MRSAYRTIDKHWLIDFYNYAYENITTEKIPIVIPSYNRYENNRFLDNVRKNMKEDWPIYVVVRKSQKELYEKNYGDLDNINFIDFEDKDIDNIGKTRIKIVEYFTRKFDHIFTVDDDLQMIIQTKAKSTNPTYKIPEKLFENIKLSDPARIFAMWQLCHLYLIDKYKDCYCTYAYINSFIIKLEYSEDRSYNVGGKAVCAVCLDLKKMKKYNLNYLSSTDTGHEDIDLVIRAMNYKLYPISIKCINFKASISNTSVITRDMKFESVRDRIVAQNKILINIYKDNPYISLNKKDNLIFNWNKYLSDIEFNQNLYGSIRKEVFDKIEKGT